MTGIQKVAAIIAAIFMLTAGLAACDQSPQQGGESPPSEQPSQQQ